MTKKDDRSLEGWMDTINRLGNQSIALKKQQEEDFFAKHKPIKEFSVIRYDEPVEYGIWQIGEPEDFLILFKVNGRYRMDNKIWYDKPIVKEVCKIIHEQEESEHGK